MAHGPTTLGEAPGVHDRGDMSAESLAGNNAAEGGDVRAQRAGSPVATESPARAGHERG
jgi:hypothetical protein